MTRINANYLGWLVRSIAKSLGLWGMIALFAMVAGVMLYSSNMSQIKQRLAQAQMAIQIQQANQSKGVSVAPVAPAQAGESLQTLTEFYGTFPTALSVPDTLSEINGLAKKHQLSLPSGDYKLNKLKAVSPSHPQVLAQYEVVLPILGSYQKIRAFIADVLTELPSVAIADVQMRRESTLAPMLDVRLVLVLFVRGEPA
jgi:Tfp pilus assembly protein PilO